MSSDLRDHVQPTVHVIQSWDWDFSNWTEITDARGVKCQKALGTSIPNASFNTSQGEFWRSGDDKNADFTEQGTDATAYLGYWVKIEADFDGDDTNNFQWFGVITDVDTTYEGGKLQTHNVSCLGPEYLLSKVQVTTAKVQRRSPDSKITIQRPVAFNAWVSTAKGRSILTGNFNGDLTPDEFAFEADPENERVWTANDAIEYLLENHAPTSTPVWELDNTTAAMLESLDFPIPTTETQGRTVYELLNQIITRRRGLVWHTVVDTVVDKFLITPATTTPTNITLPTQKDGATDDVIAANPVKHSIDYSESQELIDFRITNSMRRRFQRVRVRGDRKGVIGTFRCNVELEKVWEAADVTTYESGASSKVGYGSLLVGEKASANDAERQTEKNETVYTTYEVKPSWNGQLDGETAVTKSDNWIERMRFENYLPLLRGLNYSANPASPTGTAENEFIRPIVIIDDQAGSFHYVDRLSALAFQETWGDGVTFSCSVRILNDRLGIKVMPSTVPHAIASTDYNTGTAEPSGYSPQLDWKDIEATLYFKIDEYCESEYPVGPVTAVHNQEAELLIDIGDRARLDTVLNKTVLGIEDGAKVTAAQEGAIRDDTDTCTAIAQAAYILYGNEYNAIRYSLAILDESINVGDMIENFDNGGGSPVTANTVVSQITWDFDANTTNVVTQQFEIDVTA